jgi:DNA-binding transcriptional ArsR family regulator
MHLLSTAELVSNTFRALSVNTRVRIIELLKVGPLCVGGLAKRLGVTPAAVSQHLKLMRAAGIVTSARRGYYIHYELNPETFQRLRGLTDRFFDLAPRAGQENIQCCQSNCCRKDCHGDGESPEDGARHTQEGKHE